MKTNNAFFRIALLVFFIISISACTQSDTSLTETPVHSTEISTRTPQPKPTHTLQPSATPMPNTVWHVLAFEKASVHMITMDPVDSRILYAGVLQDEEDRLLKSFDGGGTWQTLMQYPADHINPIIYGFIIHPQNPHILYTSCQW